MNEPITKKEIIVFVTIVTAMIGSLVYGFFVVGVGKTDNCWDKYTTEYEAITNCEGKE
jgi:hypothetical protein